MSTLQIAASVLGFLASVVLFIPGWRASQYLKLIHELRTAADRESTVGSKNRAQALANILEEHTASWSQFEHRLLIGGFILLCLSFLCALIATLLTVFSSSLATC